jgi:hypothetical protein
MCGRKGDRQAASQYRPRVLLAVLCYATCREGRSPMHVSNRRPSQPGSQPYQPRRAFPFLDGLFQKFPNTSRRTSGRWLPSLLLDRTLRISELIGEFAIKFLLCDLLSFYFYSFSV